jgi:hypothetical protein
VIGFKPITAYLTARLDIEISRSSNQQCSTSL